MKVNRLDELIVQKGLVGTRSQAQNLIKLGKVRVNGNLTTKPGQIFGRESKIFVSPDEQYVGRAGYKLAGANEIFSVDFSNTIVLDVGSSTGGFTDYALKSGAKKVIAVDVGTDQLHHSLRVEQRVELHEKTDIRGVGFRAEGLGDSQTGKKDILESPPDIVVIDVSFISLREVLPHIAKLSAKNTEIIAMVKPQFEAGKSQTNKGVIKNDTIRRQILKDFEQWAKSSFVVISKADSSVAGAKGNLERFYLLRVKD